VRLPLGEGCGERLLPHVGGVESPAEDAKLTLETRHPRRGDDREHYGAERNQHRRESTSTAP
jgi:hypothetical protein